MSLNFMTTEEVFLCNSTENTSTSFAEVEDVKALAKSFLMYKIGKFLQYFSLYFTIVML